MKNIIIAISLGLTLTACGSNDTQAEKQMTNKELVAAAAAGDKDAMRKLEQQVAKQAKVENERIAEAAKEGDTLAVFHKELLGKDDGKMDRIRQIAADGNPNAQLWIAVTNSQNENLSAADKARMKESLERIVLTGDQYKYSTVANADYPLSAEAAFYLSEDLKSNNMLYALDTPRSLEYLKMAAEGGHPRAMFNLATRYQYGLNMNLDLDTAKSWLKKSAAAGNGDAKNTLKNWAE